MPAPLPPAIPRLPPTQDWVNVHSLGVTGDGNTDDTAAIRKAIDHHRVLYFPSGHYIVSDTLLLKPDTVLIGLHPTLTQFDLPDGTPAFQGVGAPASRDFRAPGRLQHPERLRSSDRRDQSPGRGRAVVCRAPLR